MELSDLRNEAVARTQNLFTVRPCHLIREEGLRDAWVEAALEADKVRYSNPRNLMPERDHVDLLVKTEDHDVWIEFKHWKSTLKLNKDDNDKLESASQPEQISHLFDLVELAERQRRAGDSGEEPVRCLFVSVIQTEAHPEGKRSSRNAKPWGPFKRCIAAEKNPNRPAANVMNEIYEMEEGAREPKKYPTFWKGKTEVSKGRFEVEVLVKKDLTQQQRQFGDWGVASCLYVMEVWGV